MNCEFDCIKETSTDELRQMDFYETALYIQTLNNIEKLNEELLGDNNE